MEKVYDIKIDDLKKLLNILKNYSSDPVVMADIGILSNYIKRLERNFSEKSISLYERLLDDAGDIHFYKPFYPFSEKFSNIGRSQNELVFNTSYSFFPISDEQAMEDAEIFFRDQGDFFYSGFSSFQEEAEDHLKFINPQTDTAGETLTLKSTGEAFVFVPNYSNITKFTILIHELEHAIDFFSNQYFLDSFVIRETSAIFMELIATDFISKKYNLFDDNFQRRNFLHTLIKSQASFLGDKNELLDLVNKHKHLKEDDLLRCLKMYDFSEEDIVFLLEESITQDYSYQLPYLIAVELYVIYHNNRKKALAVLEDIILNGDQYNIFDILNKYGIVLNKNVLYYEDCLYKKITL